MDEDGSRLLPHLLSTFRNADPETLGGGTKGGRLSVRRWLVQHLDSVSEALGEVE